mgnify:FL=1
MSSVPSVLQNKPLNRPTDMNIQSEILHPIQFNQSSTKFVFDNKGILDSNSRINLAITTEDITAFTSPAKDSATLTATSTNNETSDFVDVEMFNKQNYAGDDTASHLVATGGSTTTLEVANALGALLLAEGIKVGDRVIRTSGTSTAVTDISTITIVGAADSGAGTGRVKYTFSPAIATAFASTNQFFIFSNTTIMVVDKGGYSVNKTANYYKGLKIRQGLTINDGTAPTAVGIVNATIKSSKFVASEGLYDYDHVELEIGDYTIASSGADIGDAQKKLVATGLNASNKLGSIWNPFSAVLNTAQLEVEGFWDNYDFNAENNCLPNNVEQSVKKYFATAAQAVADAPKFSINILNPVANILYLNPTSSTTAPTGWTQALGSGGASAMEFTLDRVRAKAILPISTGISSIIKRAVLTIGGREVSSLDSVGSFNTITNMLNSTEYRDKILFHLEGVNDAMTFRKNIEGAADGYIGLKDGKNIDATFITPPYALRIEDELVNSPRFSLPLSNLIPMLKGLKLPLFAINQEVALFIEWSEDKVGHRVCEQQPSGRREIKTHIHEAECFMMCDYLYFDKEMGMIMDEINNNEWSLPYEDVITIDAQLPALSAAPTTFERTETNTLLYLGGKTLRSLIVQKQSDRKSAYNIGNNILEGIYNSRSYQRPETYNLSIDNRPIYDNDLTLSGLHYQELSRCFNTHLQIPNARYSLADLTTIVDGVHTFNREGDDGYITNVAFLGLDGGTAVPQSRMLSGNQNYFGINIGNLAGGGEKMSNLPLIFKHITERKATNLEWDDPITYKFYATIKRGMGIRRGGMVVVSD